MLNGGEGNDYLFADVALSATGTGIVVLDAANESDVIVGGGGVDNAAQFGNDQVIGVTGMLLITGAQTSVITWLKAQIMPLSIALLDDLIEMAFIDLDCEDLVDFTPSASALPALPQSLIGEEDDPSAATVLDAAFEDLDDSAP
jgi:hypothetical protein